LVVGSVPSQLLLQIKWKRMKADASVIRSAFVATFTTVRAALVDHSERVYTETKQSVIHAGQYVLHSPEVISNWSR